MTKSRTAVSTLALLASAASSMAAAGQTAADAAARQQAQARSVVAKSCPAGAGNEVVVCGRREPVQRYRAPLSAPAATREQAGGEQLAEIDAGAGRCSAAVRDQQCTRGLSVLGLGGGGVTGIVGVVAHAPASPD